MLRLLPRQAAFVQEEGRIAIVRGQVRSISSTHDERFVRGARDKCLYNQPDYCKSQSGRAAVAGGIEREG